MADTVPPAESSVTALPPGARRIVRTPAWLLVAVGALFVGGTVWLAKWYLIEPAVPADLSQYQSNEGPGMYLPPEPREAVHLRPNGGIAYVPGLRVRFTVLNGKPNVLAAGFGVAGGPSEADVQAVNAARVAVQNRTRREAAGVSAQQARTLGALIPPASTLLPPDRQAKLLNLFTRYNTTAASRPDVEEQVLTLLRGQAAANARNNGEAYHMAADRVRDVLTAEQIVKLRQLPPTPPAGRPATRPTRLR